MTLKESHAMEIGRCYARGNSHCEIHQQLAYVK